MKKNSFRKRNIYGKVILSVLAILLLLDLNAETKGQLRVTLSLKKAELVQIVENLKKQTGLRFFYQEEKLVGKFQQDIQIKDETLPNALETIFRNTGLTWQILEDVVVI